MNESRRKALLALGLGAMSIPGLLHAQPGTLLEKPKDNAAFLNAVTRGDVRVVRSMLRSDVSLASARDENGLSAYVLAQLSNRPKIVKMIQDAGIELDVIEAVLAEDWGRVEVLAKKSPKIMRQGHPIGGTPLYAAALVGHRGFWRLRGQGCLADDVPVNGSGFTPARAAMDARTHLAAMASATDLLSNGSDANAAQKGGDSILHGAVRRRDEALVRLVIRKGADVDAKDDSGLAALGLAKKIKWREGVSLLTHHKKIPRDNRSSRFAFDANRNPVRRPNLSDVSQELQSQVTSSSHMKFDEVKKLVGPDPRLSFSVSSDDELAIEASAHLGSLQIIRFHLDQGSPLSLPTAAALGDLDFIKFLLDADPTLVHERGAHDFPVMFYTAFGKDTLDAAELLHERGANVDQQSLGNTTLHWCVRRNRVELAEWLLNKGADPNQLGYLWNRAGDTPLGLARDGKRKTMVELLKKHGASDQ